MCLASPDSADPLSICLMPADAADFFSNCSFCSFAADIEEIVSNCSFCSLVVEADEFLSARKEIFVELFVAFCRWGRFFAKVLIKMPYGYVASAGSMIRHMPIPMLNTLNISGRNVSFPLQ